VTVVEGTFTHMAHIMMTVDSSCSCLAMIYCRYVLEDSSWMIVKPVSPVTVKAMLIAVRISLGYAL